eukprot:1290563-Pleurochrysis_carterae.AAC.3
MRSTLCAVAPTRPPTPIISASRNSGVKTEPKYTPDPPLGLGPHPSPSSTATQQTLSEQLAPSYLSAAHAHAIATQLRTQRATKDQEAALALLRAALPALGAAARAVSRAPRVDADATEKTRRSQRGQRRLCRRRHGRRRLSLALGSTASSRCAAARPRLELKRGACSGAKAARLDGARSIGEGGAASVRLKALSGGDHGTETIS